MSAVLVVLTTAPGEEVAATLAERLVEEELAACVHILPRGRSFYRWEGRLNREEEWTLLIKTTREGYGRLEARLAALHPYELPEILALEVAEGAGAYLAWVDGCVRGGAGS